MEKANNRRRNIGEESLSKTAFDYTLDISVIGVDDNEKYYGVSPEKGKSKITASTSAAQKYGLKKGDKLILTDSATDMDYAFTIQQQKCPMLPA